MRERYLTLLDDAVTRWDVNFIIGEFIGELNASHTYHGGGDEEQAPKRSVGMLGVDWELANGAYRIKRIVRGGPWDTDVRSPLDEPGVNVKEGDYVLAVNGVPLEPEAGSVGQLPGPGREDGRAHGQLPRRRPTGARQVRRHMPRRARSSCGSARGSKSAARSSTRRPTARSATSTCRAPASTRRTT